MQAFEYVVPRSVSEAVTLLAEKGDLARPLAGGTDLLVQMRAGRRQVERVVQIKSIPELNQLSYDPEGGLHLGAAVPCYRLWGDPAIAGAYPCLIDAAAIIGSVQIQGRASFGGNLCNAAPSADGIPPLMVLGATAIIAGPGGTREVPVEQFCTAPGRTILGVGEFLVGLRVPPPRERSGACYLRFTPRNEMDIAVAGVGVSVVLEPGGNRFASARIALSAVAPTPLLVAGVEEVIVGQPTSEETIGRVAELARSVARPITDMRGTVEQRRHLVGVLTRRAMETAIQRARGS